MDHASTTHPVASSKNSTACKMSCSQIHHKLKMYVKVPSPPVESIRKYHIFLPLSMNPWHNHNSYFENCQFRFSRFVNFVHLLQFPFR